MTADGRRILRADLVVVDDIGLLPVSHAAAEGSTGSSRRYEKWSIALSSNLHPSGFDELMLKTLATATVDRLLHHTHVCQTSGDSIRLTQALTGKGVTPLHNPKPMASTRQQVGRISWPLRMGRCCINHTLWRGERRGVRLSLLPTPDRTRSGPAPEGVVWWQP